ncbi:19548_t:CDS:1, partial [Cetraspora pellucida]
VKLIDITIQENANILTNNSNIQQEENKEGKLIPKNNRQYKDEYYS